MPEARSIKSWSSSYCAYEWLSAFCAGWFWSIQAMSSSWSTEIRDLGWECSTFFSLVSSCSLLSVALGCGQNSKLTLIVLLRLTGALWKVSGCAWQVNLSCFGVIGFVVQVQVGLQYVCGKSVAFQKRSVHYQWWGQIYQQNLWFYPDQSPGRQSMGLVKPQLFGSLLLSLVKSHGFLNGAKIYPLISLAL